jgi:hypothetical protein
MSNYVLIFTVLFGTAVLIYLYDRQFRAYASKTMMLNFKGGMQPSMIPDFPTNQTPSTKPKSSKQTNPEDLTQLISSIAHGVANFIGNVTKAPVQRNAAGDIVVDTGGNYIPFPNVGNKGFLAPGSLMRDIPYGPNQPSDTATANPDPKLYDKLPVGTGPGQRLPIPDNLFPPTPTYDPFDPFAEDPFVPPIGPE